MATPARWYESRYVRSFVCLWGQAFPCEDPETANSIVIGMEVAGKGAEASGFAENWREDSQWLK